ncbi:MAG: hypothetical protein CK425_11605 [Parachlamydia sp.]|nr:MAG: hypothetical protein CK425_11605 [Parachlamydia sp.]
MMRLNKLFSFHRIGVSKVPVILVPERPVSKKTQVQSKKIFKENAVLFFKKKWALSQRNIALGRSVGSSILRGLIFKVTGFISFLFCKTFSIRQNPASFELLNGNGKILDSQFAWHLNLALMRDAHKKTQDPDLKKQIEFLSTNYLDKAATTHLNALKWLDWRLPQMFQDGPESNCNYHRMGSRMQLDAGSKINENLAFGIESPFILTDTSDFEELLPLKFTVLDSKSKRAEWAEIITNKLKMHFTQFSPNYKDGFDSFLHSGFLIDMTSEMSESIKTHRDAHKEGFFKDQYTQFTQDLNALIALSVEKVMEEKPELKLSRRRLRKFVQENTITVCRTQIDQVTGIKILPIFHHLKGDNLAKHHAILLDFMDLTGIFIGAINMRRYIREDFNLRRDIHYAVNGVNPLYFKDPQEFTQLAVFRRFSEKVKSEALIKAKPHVTILGKAILQLTEGLAREISPDKWESLNQDPATREIVQSSLFRLKEQLANAELFIDDYKKYAQAVELAHYEIGTLLELTRPFTPADFPSIYANQLRGVPPSLRPYIQASLGKTAVNTFAGLNAALLETNRNPTCVYGNGFYYEQAAFVGIDHTLKEALEDPRVESIDFYGCQFNPNLEILTDHSHYEAGQIEADIREIFAKKPATKHLTVTIDCTIDYFNSPKSQALLSAFEEEIKSGKLNVVFFRSGQKFDMLGVDNYYGSPFYLVNNGSPQWDAYNALLTKKSHQTDLLSLQWFCLSSRYASDEIDDYRRLIFANTKEILKNVPDVLKPRETVQKLRVSTVDEAMDPCFVDLKVLGKFHKLRSYLLVGHFYKKCIDFGVKIHSKASFGFTHPNILIISLNSQSTSSSIRINPSLNPEENAVIIEYLKDLTNNT